MRSPRHFHNFVKALRFSFSNVASLAIWGILYVVTVFAAVAIIVTGVILFEDNLPVMIVLLGIAFLITIVFCVLCLGFISQCLRTVIEGGDRMPTGLESPGELVKDGVMTFLITLEAIVLELICFVPAFLLVFMAGRGDDSLVLVGLLLMVFSIPVVLIIFFLNAIQWAVYADTGSLADGLNILKSAGLVLSHPVEAFLTILSIVCAWVLFGVVVFVCEMLIVTILLLPLLIVAEYGCLMYLIGVFYRQSSGDGPDGVQDTMSAGYSVS